MGFGQFSVTSIRRTKEEQLQAAREQGYQVVNSRKAGHNRLLFTTADGGSHFMLHVTVIASVDQHHTRVTLNDGGWASVTTRKAFSEAIAAFGMPGINVGGGRPRASHSLGFQTSQGWQWGSIVFDRSVTLRCDGLTYWLDAECQPVAPPMIRAVVEGAISLEVTYRNGEVISNNGDKFEVSPTRLIITIEDMLALAKLSRRFIGGRHDPVNYKHDLPIFKGYHHAHGGRLGKAVHVGCHEFNVSDLRNILQRLKLDHPEAAAKAKAFIKSRSATPVVTAEAA